MDTEKNNRLLQDIDYIMNRTSFPSYTLKLRNKTKELITDEEYKGLNEYLLSLINTKESVNEKTQP